ncbi:transcription regulator [Moniliophthora roreri MCA 2997]|uniref:Transcription regulator n=2 Tax=Moniliophthora roreri TaxID=221103 RepID=V2XCM9_MONRO|nr:transcription regulator [Moniliophthora roreri MCA 2997]
MKLTQHLLNISTRTPYTLAINHPFLQSAGNGTLSHDLLALWLSQDRIYATRGYPRFIGLLIANLTREGNVPQLRLKGGEESSFKRIFETLVFSLTNISREMDFFNDTATKYGLRLDERGVREGTKTYLTEMDRVASEERVEHGLVFLWAMEKVYLDAWTFVKTQLGANISSDTAVASLARNWSNQNFIAFVDDLDGLVDSLNIQPDTELWKECETIWEKIVEIEAAFWPEQGEVV